MITFNGDIYQMRLISLIFRTRDSSNILNIFLLERASRDNRLLRKYDKKQLKVIKIIKDDW